MPQPVPDERRSSAGDSPPQHASASFDCTKLMHLPKSDQQKHSHLDPSTTSWPRTYSRHASLAPAQASPPDITRILCSTEPCQSPRRVRHPQSPHPHHATAAAWSASQVRRIPCAGTQRPRRGSAALHHERHMLDAHSGEESQSVPTRSPHRGHGRARGQSVRARTRSVWISVA